MKDEKAVCCIVSDYGGDSAYTAVILLIPVTSAAEQVNCPSCGGKGYNEKRIVTPNYSGDPNHHDKWVKEDCWRCRGTGKVEV